MVLEQRRPAVLDRLHGCGALRDAVDQPGGPLPDDDNLSSTDRVHVGRPRRS